LEKRTTRPANASQQINTWVNQYTDDLVRWSYYKTQNKEIAEDLVQETFLAAFRSFEGFKNRSHPKTWLFSILNNKIIDYHRKKFKELVHTQSDLKSHGNERDILEKIYNENGRWRKEARPAEWETEAIHLLDNLEFKKVLQYCLEELPGMWFSAIQMKYLEEKDGNEICQDLGISPSNFWQLLRRARLQLRACIELKWYKSE